MISGVQDVYYSVTDMKRALTFYTEALQMKFLFKEEGWIALQCGGIQIGLHPIEDGETLFQVPRDAHGVHGQATLTLKTNDVDEDRQRIERYGGRVLGEDEAPWGHVLVFEDPEGNVLKLMNPRN